ncbi:MAG: ribokinase [Ostreibacterium sp.]
MSILSFGSLNIDHVYQLDHLVSSGETIAAKHYSVHPGGKGLNQSVAMVKAGLQVFHAGRIGVDGTWLKTFLQDAKVDCHLLHCSADEHTGHAIIQVSSQGENSIVLYGGANKGWTVNAVKALFTLQMWDAIICQNEMNCLDILLNEAYQRNIPVVFNAAPYSISLRNVALHRLHSLVVNETEAMTLAEESTIAKAFARLKILYPQIRIVLTLGAKGAWASYNGKDFQQSAYPTKVIDTTAAGDTFVGYYVASLFRYNPDDLPSALALGSKAASLTIRHAGAAESIPNLEQVKPRS